MLGIALGVLAVGSDGEPVLMVMVQNIWQFKLPTQIRSRQRSRALAHPNIYSIYEACEGVDQQISSCKIFLTQVNNTVSNRIPGEDPVLIV